MTTSRARVCGALGVVLCAATLALAAPPKGDPLRIAAECDELQLARVAASAGDDAILAALGSPSDPLLQLAAIRAAPHLIDKEQALVPLAAIAASRDPELAPRAAGAVLRVAQALVREGLGRREVLPAMLTAARAALSALSADTTARADIRLYAGQAAHLLGTLGVPAGATRAQ